MKSSTLLISLLTLGTAGAGVGGYYIFTQGQTVASINKVVQPSRPEVQNQISSNQEDLGAVEIQSAKKSKVSEGRYIPRSGSEKHMWPAVLWNSW